MQNGGKIKDPLCLASFRKTPKENIKNCILLVAWERPEGEKSKLHDIYWHSRNNGERCTISVVSLNKQHMQTTSIKGARQQVYMLCWDVNRLVIGRFYKQSSRTYSNKQCCWLPYIPYLFIINLCATFCNICSYVISTSLMCVFCLNFARSPTHICYSSICAFSLFFHYQKVLILT